jgi:hypothetical protein
MLSLGSAGDLRAQSTPQVTTVAVLVSQTLGASSCAPEAVRVRGTLHLVIRTQSGPNGPASDVLFDLRHLEGTGQTAGATYRFDNTRRDRQRLPCAVGGPCMKDVFGEFTVEGAGPDEAVKGRFGVRLQTRPKVAVHGYLSEIRFSCTQE